MNKICNAKEKENKKQKNKRDESEVYQNLCLLADWHHWGNKEMNKYKMSSRVFLLSISHLFFCFAFVTVIRKSKYIVPFLWTNNALKGQSVD